MDQIRHLILRLKSHLKARGWKPGPVCWSKKRRRHTSRVKGVDLSLAWARGRSCCLQIEAYLLQAHLQAHPCDVWSAAERLLEASADALATPGGPPDEIQLGSIAIFVDVLGGRLPMASLKRLEYESRIRLRVRPMFNDGGEYTGGWMKASRGRPILKFYDKLAELRAHPWKSGVRTWYGDLPADAVVWRYEVTLDRVWIERLGLSLSDADFLNKAWQRVLDMARLMRGKKNPKEDPLWRLLRTANFTPPWSTPPMLPVPAVLTRDARLRRALGRVEGGLAEIRALEGLPLGPNGLLLAMDTFMRLAEKHGHRFSGFGAKFIRRASDLGLDDPPYGFWSRGTPGGGVLVSRNPMLTTDTVFTHAVSLEEVRRYGSSS